MENRHFDVVVVGNVGIDTNVFLAGADIDFSVESNFTENLDYVGQAGGYSSRGFARLGKRTAFVGYVGDDYSGRFIYETLAKDGIDTSGLFVDPAGTGRSVNVMYRDGRRKNFYDGKGHMQLQPDLDICRAILSQGSFAHFSIPDWARRLLLLAKNEGLTVSCDIQDVVSPDDPYRQDFIAASDILFCSAVNYPDPEPLIRQFLQRKPEQVVVVGMGAKGCALGSRDGVRFFGPVEMEAPVVDTNGAGDGLAAGFLTSYLLDHFSLEDSILRGQIAARFSCALKADSSNLITASQLDGFYHRLKGTG
jgi:sugar/nucleoside kinase (ribokinase family)